MQDYQVYKSRRPEFAQTRGQIGQIFPSPGQMSDKLGHMPKMYRKQNSIEQNNHELILPLILPLRAYTTQRQTASRVNI